MSKLHKLFHFDVALTLVAPVLSRTLEAVAFGIDAGTLLDRNGNPALPGTLIAGSLRHSMAALARITDKPDIFTLDQWFGAESPADNEPCRGTVQLSEFFVCGQPGEHTLDYRIRIDPATGRVEKGAMQVIESRFEAGTELTFKGRVSGWFLDATAADHFRFALNKGLRNINAVGAFKGVGFGRIAAVRLEPTAEDKGRPISLDASRHAHGFTLSLAPDRALCFAAHLKGNNTRYVEPEYEGDKTGLDNEFLSLDYIPGAAIKGSLFNLLKLAPKDSYPLTRQYLDNIRITHAQPVDHQYSQGRPLPLPLSVVRIGRSDFYDIAGQAQPGLIDGQAPLYCVDWKSSDAWPALGNLAKNPDRSLVLHTAIEENSQASADHQLYSYECIVPEQTRWLADFNLPTELKQNPELRAALYREIQALTAFGLHWLGKTSARAELEIYERSPIDVSVLVNSVTKQKTIRLDLVSDALILAHFSELPSSNGSQALFAAYQAAWSSLSGNALQLQSFCAEQRLMGGLYLHKRFGGQQAYNPRVLSCAGSTFVFEITDATKLKPLLEKWLASGLGQLDEDPQSWRSNPCSGLNGWGEIVVNRTSVPLPGKKWQPLSLI